MRFRRLHGVRQTLPARRGSVRLGCDRHDSVALHGIALHQFIVYTGERELRLCRGTTHAGSLRVASRPRSHIDMQAQAFGRQVHRRGRCARLIGIRSGTVAIMSVIWRSCIRWWR